MKISNNQECPVADCAVDLGPACPDVLKGPFDASGWPLGCKTACMANLDGTPENSRNCCSGEFNTPQTCPASGVQFYDYFSAWSSGLMLHECADVFLQRKGVPTRMLMRTTRRAGARCSNARLARRPIIPSRSARELSIAHMGTFWR